MSNKYVEDFETMGKELYEDKALMQVKKARVQAKLGLGDYPLNTQQKKFLKHIGRTYGKSSVKEIVEFRNKTLAPLFLIQKKTREHGTVTTRDLVGMTKKEWERAVESGENKIKRRGELAEKIRDDLRAIEFNKRSLERLEAIKRMLSGKQEIDKNLIKSELDKFLVSYNFITPGRSPKQSRMYASDIERSWKNISSELEKKDQADIKSIRGEINSILNKQFIRAQAEKKEGEKEEGYSEELANSVASFYFEKKIVDDIMSSGESVFKKFYYDFISSLIAGVRKRISEHSDNLSKRSYRLEFNEIENKVWGVNKRANKMSGDLDDYYLKIEAEDFENRGETRNIEQPEKTKRSKKRIENERYNFIQKLKSRYKISDKDFEKLQALGIFSFIDRKKILDYANRKLDGDLSPKAIKIEVNKILSKTTDERRAVEEINNLARTTINVEKTYEKAYRILGSKVSKTKAMAIADSIIKSSKTNAEVDKKLERASRALEQEGRSTEKTKTSFFG